MVSSEAKTLSLQRFTLSGEASTDQRRCNDSVFASLDRIAPARCSPGGRPIGRFIVTGFVERHLGVCQRRSNNAFEWAGSASVHSSRRDHAATQRGR